MKLSVRLRAAAAAMTIGARIMGGVAAGLLVAATAGCSHRSQASATTPVPVVYVCTETKEIITAPLQKVPAVNPKTGRSTLVRGVYCAECGRWYAAPPDTHRSGNPKPLRCPIHKSIMTFEGPPPTEDMKAAETPAAGTP
jgi:hypothetical protein